MKLLHGNGYQIVEPRQSDRAAFDPKAYHQAMRDGRSEGAVRYVVLFCGGVMLGATLTIALPFQLRMIAGLALGMAFAMAFRAWRQRGMAESAAEAVSLYAQAHELEMQANRLEIENAKASGAFDRWEKS